MMKELVEFTKSNGIMLTFRYVADNDKWYMILHLNNTITKAVDAEDADFDIAAKELLDKAKKTLVIPKLV